MRGVIRHVSGHKGQNALAVLGRQGRAADIMQRVSTGSVLNQLLLGARNRKLTTSGYVSSVVAAGTRPNCLLLATISEARS
jgi:hypothetical protein